MLRKDSISFASFHKQQHQDDVDLMVNQHHTSAEIESAKAFQHNLDILSSAALDPVVVVDEGGIIKSVNNEFLTLFGFNLWEVVGQLVNIIIPPEISVNHHTFLERYRTTRMKRIIGQPRSGVTGIKKGGDRVSLIIKVSDIVDERGSVYLGILKDVMRDEELMKIKHMLSYMLPKGYEEKISTGKIVAEQFKIGSVMFADIANFSDFTSKSDPYEIVSALNGIFEKFDEFVKSMEVEKIKTIGNSYMAAAGVTRHMYDSAIRIIECAFLMMESIHKMGNFRLRIGVGSGRVVSGILKGEKLSFDIWGDTVNVAARMQSLAPEGSVRVCPNTYSQTKYMYKYSKVEELNVKGKGLMKTYVILGRKEEEE